ncbi:phenylalanine--tRNA ligase subunit alpha [Candidatus Dojkabacteria bacterium]|uniref:Phenylalanine--tRNA ligase subunit alpha n=1 Tax=Candidatus Dojkabacteria bacterium TaxID=2099670 RepID=A0A3M0YZF0_9BACT|nr:MAG: phenylalanine--tRNA ligase subunit alpha [Candidatus Dojkabacteria bacterium]
MDIKNLELRKAYQKFLDDYSQVNQNLSESFLTELWRKYLGKNGVLTVVFRRQMSTLPKQEKKDFGIEFNLLKDFVQSLIQTKKEDLIGIEQKDYNSKVLVEFKVPEFKIGHFHPLTQTIRDINNIFRSLGYSIVDGPEIETDEYCFQRMNLPLDHPARDLQDSIYISEPDILLRTQTSSIEAHVLEDFKPPMKIVMPGRVYRNEKVNKSNHFTFHQYQMTTVQEKVSMAELFSIINYLFKTYLGEDTVVRFRCKYYPEVEPGLGPDIQCFNCKERGCALCKGRGWIEMGGAGIRHPNVLRMAGIDPEKWQGYAFGLGLDRLAMAKHGITDIRTLLSGSLVYKPKA